MSACSQYLRVVILKNDRILLRYVWPKQLTDAI